MRTIAVLPICNASPLLQYSLDDGDLTPGCEWLYVCAVYRTRATFLHPAFQAAPCTLLRLKAFTEMRFFVEICLRMSFGSPGGSWAGSWSRSRAVCAVAYPFERRHVAGAVPKAFLKAREKAASEPSPTISATWARDALVL